MRFFFFCMCAVILFIETNSIVHAQNVDNLLSSDNVFDTLSVDLKINGSDGPINVAVGERITISWESEGATRCKGNWSKKDLPFNGKISGRLNRSLIGSVTVRFACMDADGNRTDDSVVLNISNPSVINTPLTPQPPPPPPPPPPSPVPDQPIIISSCGEITKPGTYLVDTDLVSSGEPCVHIHDTNNVELNCQSRVIIGKNENYGIFVQKTSDFKISNCTLTSSINVPVDVSTQHVLRIADSQRGELYGSTINGNYASVSGATDIAIHDNKFTNQFSVYKSNRITITKNSFSNDTDPIHLESGDNNLIVSNTIDGKSDGVWRGLGGESKSIGSDDGIVIKNENHDLIQGNAIQNVWDCGIENAGTLFDSKIIGNSVKNAGYCAIGGWYWSSVKGNLIKDNVGDNIPQMFVFFRAYHLLPNEQYVYFKDNMFENNKFINPRIVVLRDGSDGFMNASRIVIEASDVPSPNIAVGSNIFKNNDFSTAALPYFSPPSMIVDGGGNICAKSSDPNYPLACGRGN